GGGPGLALRRSHRAPALDEAVRASTALPADAAVLLQLPRAARLPGRVPGAGDVPAPLVVRVRLDREVPRDEDRAPEPGDQREAAAMSRGTPQAPPPHAIPPTVDPGSEQPDMLARSVSPYTTREKV